MIANRHRIPERLAAHGRCHRALVGARLKDSYMVDSELRQLIEEGYVGPTLRCSHDPYSGVMPDAQGGIPTIIMEMLAYSRPGVIEVLPALPPSLVKGSINGMLSRTFARLDELAWDMQARTVDVTITSMKKQDVTLIARHGIEAITAPAGVLAAKPTSGTANCDLHLPAGKPFSDGGPSSVDVTVAVPDEGPALNSGCYGIEFVHARRLGHAAECEATMLCVSVLVSTGSEDWVPTANL